MSKFIGVKMVEAVPMTAIEADKKGYKVGKEVNNEVEHFPNPEGYEVIYPDGYKSWCPKNVFESSYYPIQDNNGDIIYRNDVEGFINTSETVKIGEKTTLVTLNCLTGFEIHGQSSCVKPENYNQNVGKEYAKDDAIKVIWAHLGFVLQWARNGLKRRKEVLPPHVQRLVKEHKEVEQRLTKLSTFIDFGANFKALEVEEQERLKRQRVSMDEYFHILDERLAYAFKSLNINE